MATKAKTSKPYKELGNSGVQIFNGIITGEEYNFNLMGRRALQTWDEMAKSDATVKMTLRVIKEPVKSLTFHVQPASDDEEDIKAQEFIHEQLFTVLRWKTTLHEILTHQEKGFAVFEKVLAVGEVKGHTRVYVSRLAFRKQSSIAKWEAAGKPGISQYGLGGDLIPIPLDRLVVFTNEQEGDNYEGVSVLRPAYKHWFYKDKYYQIDAIGQERQGLGVVKIKHLATAPKAHIENAHEQARALRANEEGFIDEPENWEVDFMDMKARTNKDAVPMIEHHDRQIPDSVLAGVMKLGSANAGGSNAVGGVQMAMLEQYVKSTADYVADTINRYLIRPLVDLNFNVTEYPTLVAGEVSGESLKDLATALSALITAGVIIPTDEDEAFIRGIMRLPERAEDDEGRKPEPSTKKVNDEETDELEEEQDTKKASVIARARSVLASLRKRLYGKSSRTS